MELRSLEVIFQEAEKVQREGNNTKMSRAYDGDPQDRCNAVVKRTLNSQVFSVHFYNADSNSDYGLIEWLPSMSNVYVGCRSKN